MIQALDSQSSDTMKTVRFALCLLASLRTQWLFALVPLLLSGCAGIVITSVGVGLLSLPYIASYNAAYKAHYAHSNCANIRTESSWSEGVEAFYLVDGWPADAAGYPYTYFSFTGVFVPPGPHRLLVKIGQGRFSLLEINVTAHHAYRVAAAKSDHEKLIQLWDETEGHDKRTLQQEVRNPPEAGNFLDAVRAFKAVPDSAVVAGDLPSLGGQFGEYRRKIDRAVEEDVMFKTIDGRKSEDIGLAIDMMQTRFVAAGTHRLVLKLQELGLLHNLVTLPEIEVGILAQHIYRITAKETDGQHLIQFWDETEERDQRTLVKEFRFGKKQP